MGIFFQNKKQYYTNIDMARFIDFDEENSGRPSFITSYFISQIRQIRNFTIIEVSNELIDSPDYISFKNYQREHMYWWIIMIYNNLLDFNEITFGKQIKVPSIAEINKILSSMQIAETSYDNDIVSNINLTK